MAVEFCALAVAFAVGVTLVWLDAPSPVKRTNTRHAVHRSVLASLMMIPSQILAIYFNNSNGRAMVSATYAFAYYGVDVVVNESLPSWICVTSSCRLAVAIGPYLSANESL